MSPEPLDPFSSFVHLHAGGAATVAPRTPTFWRHLVAGAGDRVVGAVHGREAGEMHPHGDELLCLLAGAVNVVLEEVDGERTVPLRAGQVFVVPQGAWHRLVLRAPADLLFVTPPKGTELRPARAR